MKRFFSKPTLMMSFLKSKGYTTGTLADRMNQYLIARSKQTASHGDVRRRAATASAKDAAQIMQDKERAFFTTANDL
jgi:hypothetical protein